MPIGQVATIITDVLASADEPMKTGDIHQTISAILGRPVSYSAIKANLVRALTAHRI